MKFQNSSIHGFKVMLCIKKRDERTDGRTDGRTDNPEAICPSNFFEVGGIKNFVGAYLRWYLVSNLRVQAGPEIKGEVTSPSWENREKFAASREKCFLTEDTPQKHDYIISSYEPLADLFFLYFNIGPNSNKTKTTKKKMLQEIFL